MEYNKLTTMVREKVSSGKTRKEIAEELGIDVLAVADILHIRVQKLKRESVKEFQETHGVVAPPLSVLGMQPVRCSGCGGMVIKPCFTCQIRKSRLKEGKPL